MKLSQPVFLMFLFISATFEAPDCTEEMGLVGVVMVAAVLVMEVVVPAVLVTLATLFFLPRPATESLTLEI